MYMTFPPPTKPAQFCNSLVACYGESKSTNGTVDFWDARIREQVWEYSVQSLSHSYCPVSCLHLTQQHTWASHTPQTQVFTEENPKKWEMHYRADCMTRVSLILFCTVWFPEAACRLPSLWVWFPLLVGLCWPRCKSLGSVVFPTLLGSKYYVHCIWNAPSFIQGTRDHSSPLHHSQFQQAVLSASTGDQYKWDMLYNEHFMMAPLSNSDHGHLHRALGDDSKARWTPVGLFLFTRSGEPGLGFTLRGRCHMHFSKAHHCASKGYRQRLCQGQFL